jgi:nucleoside-diphosphate-sugar epimerase
VLTRMDPSAEDPTGDTALSVLFIGGTGVISAAAAERSVAIGHGLTILNRGNETLRAAPEGAEVLTADMRDPASVRTALGNRAFDVVVHFVCTVSLALGARSVEASSLWGIRP